jgi:tartrate-resistant acid phosphatase type 5
VSLGKRFPNPSVFKHAQVLSGLVWIALLVGLLPSPPPVRGQVAGQPDAHHDVEASTGSTIYLPTMLNAFPPLETTLVPKGAVWKYLDDGSNRGTAWREIPFDDGSWQAGAAQLGYGDGDERTVVGYGPDANDKYTTTYFRHAFRVNNPVAYKMLDLKLLRDDGAVVYLNNREVLRSNMPAGDVTYTTPASASVGGGGEKTWHHVSISPALLASGTNVLAVEIHQRSPTSSDISLDLELTGAPAGAARFAVIGDYGASGPAEAAVADLVQRWAPDFIITVGDNNYPDGEQSTIVQNIDQYYGGFVTSRRFFPTLGNHDWRSIGCTGNICAGPYLSHLRLPGNERYYDFVRGDVHFFALDSDPHEPHGNGEESIQAGWLRNTLSNATAQWKVVYFHHAPYSSATHGPYEPMQWPFEQWGASAVLAGHDHSYERLEIRGLPYFVNGLGGAPNRYACGSPPAAGSQVCFDADHGAMLVEADDCQMRFTFVTRASVVVDTFTLGDGCSQ